MDKPADKYIQIYSDIQQETFWRVLLFCCQLVHSEGGCEGGGAEDGGNNDTKDQRWKNLQTNIFGYSVQNFWQVSSTLANIWQHLATFANR